MIELFDTYKCEFCGTVFEWKYTDLEDAKVAVYRTDNILKNVKNVNKTDFQYVIQLQCPNPKCMRRHYVEIDK